MSKSLTLQNTILHTAGNHISKLYEISLVAEAYAAGGISFSKTQFPGGEAAFAKIMRMRSERMPFASDGKFVEFASIVNTDKTNPTFKVKLYEFPTGGGDLQEVNAGSPVTLTHNVEIEGVPFEGETGD